MHIEIIKDKVCSECGAPMGKMINADGDLLGNTCYGKTPHIRDATNEEMSQHNAERLMDFLEL